MPRPKNSRQTESAFSAIQSTEKLTLMSCVEFCNEWRQMYKKAGPSQKYNLVGLVQELKGSLVTPILSWKTPEAIHENLYRLRAENEKVNEVCISTSQVKYLYNLTLILNSIHKFMDHKDLGPQAKDSGSLTVSTKKIPVFSDAETVKKDIDRVTKQLTRYLIWVSKSQDFGTFLNDKRHQNQQTPCRDLNNLLSFGLGNQLEWSQIQEIIQALLNHLKPTEWRVYLHLFSCYSCIYDSPTFVELGSSPLTANSSQISYNRKCADGWSFFGDSKLKNLMKHCKDIFIEKQSVNASEFDEGQDFYSMIIRSCDSQSFREAIKTWLLDPSTLQNVRTNTTFRLVLGLSLRRTIPVVFNYDHPESVNLTEYQTKQIGIFFESWLKSSNTDSMLYMAVSNLKNIIINFHNKSANALVDLTQLNHTLSHFFYVSIHNEKIKAQRDNRTRVIKPCKEILKMLCQACNDIVEKSIYKPEHLKNYIISLIGLCEIIFVKYEAEALSEQIFETTQSSAEKKPPQSMEEIQKRILCEIESGTSPNQNDVTKSLYDRIELCLSKPKASDDDEFIAETQIRRFQSLTAEFENFYSDIITQLNSFMMTSDQVAVIEKGLRTSVYGDKLKRIMKPRYMLARRWRMNHNFRNYIAALMLLMSLIFGVKEQFILMSVAFSAMVFIMAHREILEFINPNPEYFAFGLKLISCVCALLSLSSLFPQALLVLGNTSIELLVLSFVLIVFSEIVAHNERACTEELIYDWTTKTKPQKDSLTISDVKHTPAIRAEPPTTEEITSFSLG